MKQEGFQNDIKVVSGWSKRPGASHNAKSVVTCFVANKMQLEGSQNDVKVVSKIEATGGTKLYPSLSRMEQKCAPGAGHNAKFSVQGFDVSSSTTRQTLRV